ncbi:amidohydrolase family protein [Acidobacteriota bacterium]
MFRKEMLSVILLKRFNRHKSPFVAVVIAIISGFIPPSIHSQSVIAIKGGTVITMAGQTLKSGIVLIKDGKIIKVGEGISIPKEAKVINASGKFVMPGFIDAMTYYGIRPSDLTDTSSPVTPQNRIINAYSPVEDFNFEKSGVRRDQELLRGGITTIYIAPGNGQVIGGQGAVVKTHGRDFESLVLREPAAMDMTLGDSPKNRLYGIQTPTTRMAVASLIRKVLSNAQEYDRKIREFKKNSEAERKYTSKDDKKKAKAPERDLGMEALAKVLQKVMPVRIEADLADDIRTAIRLKEEFKFDLIIDRGLAAYKLKDVLSEKDIPVVLGPLSHPYKPVYREYLPQSELYTQLNEYNAALLTKAGVKIAIASFGYGSEYSVSSYHGKWLMIEAAIATGFGLPEEDALKAITINPAEILGVDDRTGSLEAGKDADVIILSGPPLDVKSWVEYVFIDGNLIYTRGTN